MARLEGMGEGNTRLQLRQALVRAHPPSSPYADGSQIANLASGEISLPRHVPKSYSVDSLIYQAGNTGRDVFGKKPAWSPADPPIASLAGVTQNRSLKTASRVGQLTSHRLGRLEPVGENRISGRSGRRVLNGHRWCHGTPDQATGTIQPLDDVQIRCARIET